MRLHGEATTVEVLKLYEIAAEDDPNDWKTNWEIGDLSFQEFDVDHAAAAFARAVAVARTDHEREAATRSLGFTPGPAGEIFRCGQEPPVLHSTSRSSSSRPNRSRPPR